MARALGQVCRAYREQAGLRQVDIATEANVVRHNTISNFERGGWWVRETDRIVAAYAKLCSVPEIEIWQRALDSYQRQTPRKPKPPRR